MLETLKQTCFELGLLISVVFLFQVFKATDNLKAAGATDWFLSVNENFFELKACLAMFFRKYFGTNFIFNGSAGITCA